MMNNYYSEQLQASTGGNRTYASHHPESTVGSPLPSLVDINKCTDNRGPGGQLGQMERQLLNVQGSSAPMEVPPDTLHLPPIALHRSSGSGVPTGTSWPITSNMLSSLVKSVHINQ